MIVLASAVVIAIMAAMLTAVNNGVRVSFAMALDTEMPGIMGSLHPRYATPYMAVVLISLVSAIIGSIGVIGGPAALLGFTLAANMGSFALYAIICILAVIPTPYTRTSLRRALPALLGALVNMGMLVAMLFIGLRLQGIAFQATWLAVIVALVYLFASLLIYWMRRKQK